MHRGLELLDVVELICEQVAQQYSFEGRDRDLASLARTSKKFLDPSLNALWKEQHTICNLLKCMPDDLWDISVDDARNRQRLDITLRRTITGADWQRPLFYLRRVKSFSLRAVIETPDFLQALSVSLPGDYLFPNLKSLTWWPQEPYIDAGSDFHHIRLFLSPHVRQLTMGGIVTATDLSILSNLAVRRPALTHVTLSPQHHSSSSDNPNPWDSATPVISSFVRGLTQLVSLDVPSLDDMALAHLAQLPGLTTLVVQSDERVSSSFQLPHCIPWPQPGYFPVLDSLTVPTMAYATAFLTKFPGCSLADLIISSTQSTKDDARQLYSALANHCSHSPLQDIHVVDDYDNPIIDEDHAYSVGGDIIEPIFSFVNITSVSLSHPAGFDLDNTIISRMARAWPRIEFLALEAGGTRHVRSRVTLEGLYSFAKHCPKLFILEMSFDATVVPRIRINGKKRAKQQSLGLLQVALSPLSRPTDVATFLAVIFPHLSRIRTQYDEILDARVDDDDESDEDDDMADPRVIALHRMWKEVQDEL
ncbi:hypothetical protein DFH06DRAFT_1081835 [Mycena polygramma]|nr:hypothetical protein DFH06DRAFT_1081835 [Mycena polygramma]